MNSRKLIRFISQNIIASLAAIFCLVATPVYLFLGDDSVTERIRSVGLLGFLSWLLGSVVFAVCRRRQRRGVSREDLIRQFRFTRESLRWAFWITIVMAAFALGANSGMAIITGVLLQPLVLMYFTIITVCDVRGEHDGKATETNNNTETQMENN